MYIRTCFFGACGLLAMSAAFADEMTFSGTGYGTTENTVHMVADGHMLMELKTAYSGFEIDDPDNPMNGMTGPCFGAMEVKGAAVTGGGRCLYTDADGDMVSMQWTPEAMAADGAVTGSWSVSGGTGKWMDASGEGTFSSLANPDTGESANSVIGKVMLP